MRIGLLLLLKLRYPRARRVREEMRLGRNVGEDMPRMASMVPDLPLIRRT